MSDINKAIQELVEVVQVASKQTWIDYCMVWVPIVLSIIAIGISVYTIQSQNRLSLFDKRYEVLYILGFLTNIVRDIIDGKGRSEKELLNAYKENYILMNGFNASHDIDDSTFYYALNMEIVKINVLFPKNKVQAVNDFMDVFVQYISNVYGEKSTEEDKILLEEKLSIMEEKKIDALLEKYLNVY